MRWKLWLAYDGTNYLGWQSQKAGGTVQDALEAQLEKIFKRLVRLNGASRTDSGVHARAQVAHFDADWIHGADKLKRALNSGLGEGIAVMKVSRCRDDFHARFSARGKRYRYTILLREPTPFEVRWAWGVDYEINRTNLVRALKSFEGKHDFRAFAGAVNPQEMTVKTIYRCRAIWHGTKKLVIEVEGSGFLYKMVRSIVGAAVDVARGKMALARVRELLENPQRTHEVVTAPARGLCLERVFYK
jgi:tRNA pseudouridine38-40 synthase